MWSVRVVAVLLIVGAGVMGDRTFFRAAEAKPSYLGRTLPLTFELNRGQVDRRVDFIAHGAGDTLYLSGGQAELAFARSESPDAMLRGLERGHQASTSSILRLRPVDARRTHAVGIHRLAGTVNYLIGRNQSRWHRDIPTFARVEYRGVYRGIDLTYYGSQGNLEYDWIVHPGANPKSIKLRIEGSTRTALDGDGNLTIQSEAGQVRQRRPVVYQIVGTHRQVVTSRFAMTGSNQVAFVLGRYNRAHPLVIDPEIEVLSYLGGTGSDTGSSIKVDGAGNAYIAGRTASMDFPRAGTYHGGVSDVFVTKLDANGSPIYTTLIGGKGIDSARGIDVNSLGQAVVTGYTTSGDFPLQAAVQSVRKAPITVFIIELTVQGDGLIFGSYFGGTGGETGSDIVVDSQGDIFITGSTFSSDFPTTPNAAQPSYGGGDFDGFVLEIGPSYAVKLSTFWGGNGDDELFSIDVNTNGGFVVAGMTNSLNFSTKNAFQSSFGGGPYDAAISGFNAADQTMFSSYLGGNGDDAATAIEFDAFGRIWVGGDTTSTNLGFFTGTPAKPTATPTVIITPVPGEVELHGFVRVVKADGTIADVKGGTLPVDFGSISSLDTQAAAGGIEVFIGGINPQGPFVPTVTPVAERMHARSSAADRTDRTLPDVLAAAGGRDAQVAALRVDAAGNVLGDGFYTFGGSGSDVVSAIAAGASASVYVTGFTNSLGLPVVKAAQPAYGGGASDAFFAKIRSLLPPAPTATPVPTSTSKPAAKKHCKKGYKIVHGKCKKKKR